MGVSYINEFGGAADLGLVDIENFDIGGQASPNMYNLTIKEITLTESLFTQSPQTAVTVQSAIYLPVGKNYDTFKNQPISFGLKGKNSGLSVTQKVYRIDNRMFNPTNVGQTEEFVIHAIDQTTLNDAKSLVSQSWSCKTPNKIVSQVLQECCGANNLDVQECNPTKDYIAENIHPFQVVNQQANVALDGDDPSFIHYATYSSGGVTHHFRSLKNLASRGPSAFYYYGDTGTGGSGRTDKNNAASGSYENPQIAIAFSFPCDFDYLSDLLNGVDTDGSNGNSLSVFNPNSKSTSLLGNQSIDCGLGGFNFKQAMTNNGTEKAQDSCKVNVEKYLLKRQARMSLLERDKIALRILVPFNGNLHAGDVINFSWKNKEDPRVDVYGAGSFLISSMSHTIRLGGFSTTTLDCVASSVGQGIAG